MEGAGVIQFPGLSQAGNMQTLRTIAEMRAWSASEHAAGRRIVFVPTMGALHEGHLSLIDLARTKGDRVVLSIFVNATQFGPNEDFEKYPRREEEDSALCEARGVDLIFAPAHGELYPEGHSVFVVEEALAKTMCGISRPVHFRGVCTIVLKLFNIVSPDVAIFGQKDAQQVAVIRRMVRDLDLLVEIVAAPTLRDPDGLAMSSRNAYLSTAQREEALAISKALFRAREMVESGVVNIDRLQAEIIHILSQKRRLRVIYVALVDRDSLEVLRDIVPGRSLFAVAVWCDQVRLIDNIVL